MASALERAARSDEVLMRRYSQGDGEAFEVLFTRYESRAYDYFIKRTGSRDRAQDLYQELFLRLHRARDTYDPRRPFAPWFFQIAHHVWIDDVRRAYRSQEVALEGRMEPRSEVRDGARCANDRDELERALGSLSSEERFVLISAKLEGRAYGELAATLGKSADAVKQLASRALRRLRSDGLAASRAARAPTS
jgi:RNA polymerase sigma-70 factor (ECF subfamily)